MKELAVVIPAIKKNVAFADDLVKKIHGITLIQRAINTGKEIGPAENVIVVTDSKEINLISERNGVHCFLKPELCLTTSDILHDLQFFLLKLYKHYSNLLILFPYCPTIFLPTIQAAFAVFKNSDCDVLISVKEEKKRVFFDEHYDFRETISNDLPRKLLIEVRAFAFLKAGLIKNYHGNYKLHTFPVNDTHVEITNYQDWWVCEKLLKRKRIVFRVIGNNEVGMGHIFRSLSLAHEITDHEVIFLCDSESSLAVNTIAGADYLVENSSKERLDQITLALKPDLVINDCLNTTAENVSLLMKSGIKVVNFEDLGSGAPVADLTINELFEKRLIKGKNILWGSKYLFLRDEFIGAKPREFQEKVENVLLTFGGSDPANLTCDVLEILFPFFKKEEIRLFVILGEGYNHKAQLMDFFTKNPYPKLELSFATGVMSKYMEQADIAMCSNGQTVYEMAHMKIPSIVLSQNERELSHKFPCEKNGFISLGLFENTKTKRNLVGQFEKLYSNTSFRKDLHEKMKHFNFLRNKKKVVGMILSLLDKD